MKNKKIIILFLGLFLHQIITAQTVRDNLLNYFSYESDRVNFTPTDNNLNQANQLYNDLGIVINGNSISMSRTSNATYPSPSDYKYWSGDFWDIEQAIMPLANDWYMNGNEVSKDKAINLLHLWASLYLYEPGQYQLKVFRDWRDFRDWETDSYTVASEVFTLPLNNNQSIELTATKASHTLNATVTNSSVTVNWNSNSSNRFWVTLIPVNRIYKTGFPWSDIDNTTPSVNFRSYNSDYKYMDENGVTQPRNLPNYYYGTLGARRAAAILADVLPHHIKLKVKERLYFNSLLSDIYTDNFSNFFVNSDFMYNLAEGALTYLAFYEEDEIIKNQKLHVYKKYLEEFIKPSSNRSSTFKPDGTGHHHYMHYNAYMSSLNPYIRLVTVLTNTPFQISNSSFNNLKKAVFTISNTSNPFDELPFLNGRHPFRIYNTVYDVSFEKLSEIESSYDSNNPIFQKLLDYKRNGADLGIEGFWQYNYGVTGVYRKNNWITGIIGVGSTFSGGEISANSSGRNMYGRYQAYGTLMTLYKGRNNLYTSTYDKSGFSKYGDGWDWNKWPGTTSIVLPWDKLKYEYYDYPISKKDFAGTLRFKQNEIFNGGEIGMFGMDFQEEEGVGYKNDSFKFKKSAFFFDNKILMLGSNIENDENNFETVTTLFQNILHTNEMPIEIDDNRVTGLPYSTSLTTDSDHYLIDAFGTGYYVKPNVQVKLERKIQHTPSLDNYTATETNCNNTTTASFQNCFNDKPAATAIIEHGTSPVNGNYEYVVLPEVKKEYLKNYKADEYEIIQKDSIAHIVNLPNNITGYAIFSPNTNLNHEIIKSVSEPVLIMNQLKGNTADFTIVDPFLNYRLHDSYSLKPDTRSTIKVKLKGKWNLVNDNDIELTHFGNDTELTVVVKDGLPKDFTLFNLDIESNFKTELDVYPNPTKNNVTVSFNKAYQKLDVYIYDSTGKQLAIKSFTNTNKFTIPLSYSSGIYFIKIVTQTGESEFVKVIKK